MLANVRPSVIRLSVVRPVIISWKENKIDPQLLWNTIGTTDSVAALRSFPRRPWEIFWVQTEICSNINTTSCSTWRQTAAVVNRARPSSHRRCCQLLKTECDRHNLLLTIISTVASCNATTPVVGRQSQKSGRPASYRSGDILVYFKSASCNLYPVWSPVSRPWTDFRFLEVDIAIEEICAIQNVYSCLYASFSC